MQVVICKSCGTRQLLKVGGCKRCGHIETEYVDGPVPYEDYEHVKPPGRNEPCRCGSGKKFKKCCGG